MKQRESPHLIEALKNHYPRKASVVIAASVESYSIAFSLCLRRRSSVEPADAIEIRSTEYTRAVEVTVLSY